MYPEYISTHQIYPKLHCNAFLCVNNNQSLFIIFSMNVIYEGNKSFKTSVESRQAYNFKNRHLLELPSPAEFDDQSKATCHSRCDMYFTSLCLWLGQLLKRKGDLPSMICMALTHHLSRAWTQLGLLDIAANTQPYGKPPHTCFHKAEPPTLGF